MFVQNCKVGRLLMKYLGLPIGVDPRKKRTWELVVEVIKKRLRSWATKQLSLGGRVLVMRILKLAKYRLKAQVEKGEGPSREGQSPRVEKDEGPSGEG